MPDKITAASGGSRLQSRFAVDADWSRVGSTVNVSPKQPYFIPDFKTGHSGISLISITCSPKVLAM